MRRSNVVCMLMCFAWAVCLMAGGTETLSRSDVEAFEGTWRLDAAQSSATDPEVRTITVGDGWMRLEIHRPEDDRPPALVYNLDGTRRVGPFGAGTATTEIRRDQNEIVTSTVVSVNERPVTIVERMKMTPAGELATTVRVRVEHGYEGVVPPLATDTPNVGQAVKLFRRIG